MKKTMKFVLIACLILIACSLVACGDSSEPQAHVHSYTEWTTTKAPTCTEEGIKERDCSCGDIQTTSIPATGHSLGSWTTTKAVTCTVDGTEERICSCGYRQTISIPATGHSFGSWTTTKAATCTVDGTEERVCSCGEKETRAVAGSHSWEAATCVKAKTCTKCGETTGSKAEHSYREATCAEPAKCKYCGKSDGYPLGHNVEFGTAECTRCDAKSTIKITNNIPSQYKCYTTRNKHYATLEIVSITEVSSNEFDVLIKVLYRDYYIPSIGYKLVDPSGVVITNSTTPIGDIEPGETTRVQLSFSLYDQPILGEYKLTFCDEK